MRGFDHCSHLFNRLVVGSKKGYGSIFTAKSKTTLGVLQVLVDEGYIHGVRNAADERFFEVFLKYSDGKPVISAARRISTPGRKVDVQIKYLPAYNNGLGIWILNTKKGVLSDQQARRLNIGGAVLGSIF